MAIRKHLEDILSATRSFGLRLRPHLRGHLVLLRLPHHHVQLGTADGTFCEQETNLQDSIRNDGARLQCGDHGIPLGYGLASIPDVQGCLFPTHLDTEERHVCLKEKARKEDNDQPQQFSTHHSHAEHPETTTTSPSITRYCTRMAYQQDFNSKI